MKTFTESLRIDLENLRKVLKRLIEYSGNPSYKESQRKIRLELNKDCKRIEKFVKQEHEYLEPQLKDLKETINILINDNNNRERLPVIDEALKILDELDVEVEPSAKSNFEIPDQSPKEIRDALKEAIDCLSVNCCKASVVMSRHAYEAALLIKCKEVENRPAIEYDKCSACQKEIDICPNPECNKKLPEKPMSITKLHAWALKKELIPKQFSDIGYSISKIGAFGAHPFILDANPDDADLAIRMVIFLLKKLKP